MAADIHTVQRRPQTTCQFNEEKAKASATLTKPSNSERGLKRECNELWVTQGAVHNQNAGVFKKDHWMVINLEREGERQR